MSIFHKRRFLIHRIKPTSNLHQTHIKQWEAHKLEMFIKYSSNTNQIRTSHTNHQTSIKQFQPNPHQTINKQAVTATSDIHDKCTQIANKHTSNEYQIPIKRVWIKCTSNPQQTKWRHVNLSKWKPHGLTWSYLHQIVIKQDANAEQTQFKHQSNIAFQSNTSSWSNSHQIAKWVWWQFECTLM